MNILLLNYEFPPLGGGGGIISWYLAREWAKQHRVDVITTHFGNLPYAEEIDGVRIFRVPVLMRTRMETATLASVVSFPLAGLIQGMMLCRRSKYDIINTHFMLPTGPLGAFLAARFSVPNVISLHGGDIYDPTKAFSPHRHFFLRCLISRIARSADATVSNSSIVKNKAEQIYGICGINVIPLGIPPIEFCPVSRAQLGLCDGDILIVSLGRLIERKGFEYVLRALARLPMANVKLLLMGDGPLKPHLIKLSRSLSIEHKVIFLGAVSGEKKYQYLSVSDVFCLPSLYEPFGLVLLEAMQCGLPIVAADYGGHIDFLQEGKTGFCVPPKDDGALAEKLAYIISEKGLASTMSRYNREYAKNFLIHVTAQKYERLFANHARK